MATLTIKLDTRSKNKAGLHPIKLLLTHRNTNTTISTGCFTSPQWYTGDPLNAVTKSAPMAGAINTTIKNIYAKYTSYLSTISLTSDIYNMSAADIRFAVEGKSAKENKKKKHTFTDVYNEFIGLCRAPKTKVGYEYAYKYLCAYLEKQIVEFSDVTYRTLTAMDLYLEKEGKKMNTRSVIFRNIRAIYNYAIKTDAIEYSSYPFKNFKIQKGHKEKEFLTIEQLRQIRDAKLEGTLEKARDFFMLSFYLCGINPTDLYHLKYSKDAITFIRQKEAHTNPLPIHIGIQKEAQEIIDKYSSKEYLISFAKQYPNYNTFHRNFTRYISQVGDLFGFKLYYYMARYTWATFAAKLQVPIDVVSKALGHADRSVAEQYYITFDWNRVNTANRTVIDYVNSDIV